LTIDAHFSTITFSFSTRSDEQAQNNKISILFTLTIQDGNITDLFSQSFSYWSTEYEIISPVESIILTISAPSILVLTAGTLYYYYITLTI
jgi:hypothetical protein